MGTGCNRRGDESVTGGHSDGVGDRRYIGTPVRIRVPEKAEGSRSDEEEDGITAVDRVVSDLHGEYRSTLRRGVLDSREDFDPLILARELDAGVATEDTGIINWAEDFGLRYLRGRDFPTLLDEYFGVRVGDRYPE